MRLKAGAVLLILLIAGTTPIADLDAGQITALQVISCSKGDKAGL